jgi:hypothetical protein
MLFDFLEKFHCINTGFETIQTKQKVQEKEIGEKGLRKVIPVDKNVNIQKPFYMVFRLPSRVSSVVIALRYGLDDRGSRVRFPARAENFSLNHHVQNGTGAHPASYLMGNRGSIPGGKAAGA